MIPLDTGISSQPAGSLTKKVSVVLCLVIILLCPPPQFKTVHGATSSQTAKQLLSQASYYYSIDDISDRASDLYRQILAKYPNSLEAEQAQFYLGLYFHKKFYCLRNRSKIDNWSAFNNAEEALNAYIKKYSSRGTKSYLADAYFTLAIIYLQRGGDTNRKRAIDYLNKMNVAASKDSRVYVEYIVWTPNPKENINAYCDTRKLAAVSLAPLGSSNYSDFDSLLYDLRKWGRSYCR